MSDRPSTAPSNLIDAYRGYVNAWECDEMGHMNIQFYVGKTSDASFHLRAALGLGHKEIAKSGTTYVALEHHIRFHRELYGSDLVLVRSGVAELRDKTMRIYQEMRNGLSNEVAATLVVDVGHLDMTTRRLVPWRDETRERATKLAVAMPDFAEPRSLAWGSLERGLSLARAEELGMFESNRSAVNAWECDTNQHMNARFYLSRFSECQAHMWASTGINRHLQAERNWGTATLEMRIAYLREMTAGQTLYVRTGLAGAGEKTLHYRHWMFDAETDEPVAASEGVALLFDKDTRRAMSLPEEFRQQIKSMLGVPS